MDQCRKCQRSHIKFWYSYWQVLKSIYRFDAVFFFNNTYDARLLCLMLQMGDHLFLKCCCLISDNDKMYSLMYLLMFY